MNAMVISAGTRSRHANNSAAGVAAPWRFQPATGVAVNGSAPAPGSAKPGKIQPGPIQADTDPKGSDKARIQLTRRGRLVLLGVPAIVTAAVMAFAALAIGLGSIATPAQASAEYTAVDLADYAVSVTVLPGDNLWSIASASNPNGDVRDVVSEIVALNELGSGVLQAGQRLYVPLPK